MAEIEASELSEGLEAASREKARDLANKWFSRSQEMLQKRGDDVEYEYFPILQGARPPQWTGEAWQFSYPHEASKYMEYGTEAHEIEAKEADMLAFEWPDAPPEVREMFEDTFPTVFFKSVEVEGVRELRYIRDSRTEVAAEVNRG
jgi:hypothetical protein